MTKITILFFFKLLIFTFVVSFVFLFLLMTAICKLPAPSDVAFAYALESVGRRGMLAFQLSSFLSIVVSPFAAIIAWRKGTIEM